MSVSSVDGLDNKLPLDGMRVLEFFNEHSPSTGRLLADLGAEVVLIEPKVGSSSRHAEPVHNDTSLFFASHNANKLSVTLDVETEDGRAKFLQLVAGADILIEGTQVGTMERVGLTVSTLHQANPQLVVLSITDFGQTGSYSGFIGSATVHAAMAGVLCRSGLPGSNAPPLLPPSALGPEMCAVQAAWCALLSYWQRLEIGVGDHLDFSLFEGTAQIYDPILGVTGSAAGGKSMMQLAQVRGRPSAGMLYPIFRCADGFVRMCILNARQWDGMSDWLGDHPFTDPKYRVLSNRFAVMGDIIALIGELTATLNKSEIVAEGQARGIPVAALATPAEVLDDPHFAHRQVFADLELAPECVGRIPSGYLEIDHQRAGIVTPAPAPGQHNSDVYSRWHAREYTGQEYAAASQQRPFFGLRVLDMGVIVAGAEGGRIFADQGAEVIKIENRAYPDGSRQGCTADRVSFAFAQGHRGKKSFGVNLRTTEGIEVFKQLVAKSDIVLSNFKPGTLESLGLAYEVLREVNPGIIMADCSALGNSGPASRSMGYGPLTRASTGLTSLWRYPDDDESFCDGITIVPDHFVARVLGVGVLAQLLRRRKTGVGGTVSVSMAEAIINALSTDFLRESLEPGSLIPRGNRGEFTAPDNVFPCAGDDEWCAISVKNDQQWLRLCEVIGRTDLSDDPSLSTASGRLKHVDAIETAVTEWTSARSPDDVMHYLQAGGVPAGKMLRLEEMESVLHLRERGFIRQLRQTGFDESWPTENGPVRAVNLPDPDIRPAPLHGENTRQIASQVLGKNEAEIDDLVERGVLETPAVIET